MLRQSVVFESQVPESGDAFEQFAIEEFGAEIVQIQEDPDQLAAGFCWWAGRGNGSVEPPLSKQLYERPHTYLEHLLAIPQLAAPSIAGLLPAAASVSAGVYQRPDVATFEQWLETDLGQEVHRRIMSNRHAVPMDSVAAYFDTTADVQQKALIWLWQRWQSDPGYTTLARHATTLSHAAGCITKVAVQRSRCKYAKRRREGREKQTDLVAEDGYELVASTRLTVEAVRATDVHEHDRLGQGSDKRADVRQAVEAVVQWMVTHHSIAKGNYRRVPIEHITRVVIEGYMYHYTDRYSQTGNFRQFCEGRGVSKNQIARWRPQIFDCLRAELAAYTPTY